MKPTSIKDFSASINLNKIFAVREVSVKGKAFLHLDFLPGTLQPDGKKEVLLLVANQRKEFSNEFKETHNIKAFMTGEAFADMKNTFGDKIPFCGNLLDWAKHEKSLKGMQIDETYIRISLNLFMLSGVAKVPNQSGFYIPIEENYIIKGSNGFYLAFKGFPLKNTGQMFNFTQKRLEATHIIKLSPDTKIYNTLSDEQKNKLPILGNAGEAINMPVQEVATISADDLGEALTQP